MLYKKPGNSSTNGSRNNSNRHFDSDGFLSQAGEIQISSRAVERSISLLPLSHYGFRNQNRDSNPAQQSEYELLTQNIEILPVDDLCIESAATIYKSLKPQNALIELADLLIGATAISNSLSLISHAELQAFRAHPQSYID